MKILFILLLSVFCHSLYADPINTVWRYDERSPGSLPGEDDVFTNGLSSWGNNDDIYQHMRGASCQTGSRTSAFVATTTYRRYAEQLQELRLSRRIRAAESPDRIIGYIYEIRADDNFNHLQTSYNDYLMRTNADIPNIAYAGYAFEYISRGVIPARNIRSVTITTVNERGEIQPSVTTLNPNYVHEDTSASTEPYRGTTAFRERLRTLVAMMPIFGACTFSQRDELKSSTTDIDRFVYLEDIIY